eukprot:gene4793-5978_t
MGLPPGVTNPRILINGTPGIGKSIFVHDNFHYFSYEKNDPVVSTFPIGSLVRYLPSLARPYNFNLIYITDGPMPETIYMPLWSKEELLNTLPLYPLKSKEFIDEAYNIAGGSARLILNTPSIDSLKNSIQTAIDSTNIDDCWKDCGLIGSSDNASSTVFNMQIDHTFKRFSFVFASRWVTQQVLAKKLLDTDLPVLNFFNTANEALNETAGQLYEEYAIKSLLQSKTFTVITKDNHKTTIQLESPSGSTTFSNFDEWDTPHTLFVPTSKSFSAIDLFLTPGCLFQISKAKDHKPLPANDITNYVEKLRSIHKQQNNTEPLKVYLISIAPSNEEKYQKKLTYKDPGKDFRLFEKELEITQCLYVLPYPNIENLKNLNRY